MPLPSTTSPALPLSDAECWQAVVERDSSADGWFYYSVSSTGIYCRPSCPSRLARRERVQFHATCMAAEQAGFRPCKRCQPDQAPRDQQQKATLITNACRMMETADTLPDLDTLACEAGLSRFHFHRVFKAITGVTPKSYADALRAQRARQALTHSPTVTDAIYDAGFQSNGRFYATSTRLLGMTPSQFRAGGSHTVIRFAVGACALGTILVAATEKGVCAIFLGDDADKLVRDLQDQFPRAELIGGEDEFDLWVAQVVGFVEAPALGLDLPLDIRGTIFQQRVWQALREIPAGSTASYTDIAMRIGSPKAVRAVAQACAANVLAVAIPCHRVVRIDGGLSGYRWGVERKRDLLMREIIK